MSDVALNAGKLNKTQSFCAYTTKNVPLKDNSEDDFIYKTPQPPPRQQYRVYDVQSAEKFRLDARERARGKSSHDLGLSPDDKMMEIRKKYNINSNKSDFVSQLPTGSTKFDKNQSDDMKFREMRMSVSKSYNDISLIKKFSMGSNENVAAYEFQRINDFVSDPNLIDAIEKEQQLLKGNTAPVVKKPLKASRRDSERRKSLIQTVSDFFTKKKDSTSNKDLTTTSSPSKDTGSSSGMFSRFRISPKSKENKEKAKVITNFYYFSD
jgi:hypothetical protein